MFMLQRVLSQFSVQFFCLTVRNHFIKEAFSAVFQKKSGRENFMEKKGEGVSKVSVEIFLSHNAEKFRRGIF